MATSVRLRDGDREIEVSGGPGFVRQILDELPGLMNRLHGDASSTPASIRMPSPTPQITAPIPAPVAAVTPPPDSAPAVPVSVSPPTAETADDASVEERVLAALRSSAQPLPISAIRHQIGNEVTGQQVRRILERAGRRVVASGDRPMRYRLR